MPRLMEFLVIVLAGVAVSIIVRGINAEVDRLKRDREVYAAQRRMGIGRPAEPASKPAIRFSWGRDKKGEDGK